MSDNEVEEVSFLPGDTILNKKAVYEPSGTQRCRQLVCSRSWAITILILMGLFLVLIAIIASFARPQSVPCNPLDMVAPAVTTPAPKTETYIATNGKVFPWKDIRLPSSIIPESYDIFMHPNISQSHFKGSVKIKAKAASTTDFIVFHIKDLNITHFDVKSLRSGQLVLASDYLEYKESEQFYIKLNRSLDEGEEINIEVKFEAKLVSKLAGFYKSAYKLSSGESRDIATTHFEPTDARAAFPCFDEPQMKANFTMSIVRQKNHISLFNMPLKDSKRFEYDDNLMLDSYETSVKMSTYLVAFVVCDFVSISNTTSDGIKVSVYAPSEQIDQANFALEAAVDVLQYYNTFFGVKYPLPKQDLIAVPDFAAGAMENWGLITYRMSAILYDEKESSLGNKQWVATVIAHELAHQWFGNLVTMEWWDDLWLNEGFASYVEYIGSNVISPEFHMPEQFVKNHLMRAMYLDSLSNSHPIHVPVNHPDQINEIFDQISYSKGGSILRMLRNILGEKNFHNGLTNYLTVHKYGNARTDDLWSALQGMSNQGVDVKAVMDTWTKQMGFPVVTVTQTGTRLALKQERFVLNPANVNDAVPESPFNYKWYIPLTLVTSSDTKTFQLTWMNMSSAETTVPSSIKWVKANAGMYGFYRVNYDETNWQALIKQLKDDHKVFSAEDRAGLIDDAFNLARAGMVSQKVALDLTLYLKDEVDFVPWNAALDNIVYIENRIMYTEVFSNFKKYMLDLISQRLAALGWEDQGSHLERFLRGSILAWAIKLGHQPSIDKGLELFQKWTQDPSSISPNLKNVVYRTGVEYGNEDNWKSCWDVYESSNVPSEKQKMLVAMANTKDTRLLNQYLTFSLDKTKIRSQDTDTVVTSVASNPSGQVLAWRFFEQNWDVFNDRYSMGSFSMSRLIKGVAGNFNTQFDYNEVQDFFAKRDAHSGTRAVKQSLEKIHMNIDWMEKHEAEITDWLHKKYPTT